MRAQDFLNEYDYGQVAKTPNRSQYTFITPKGMIYTVSLKRDFDMDHNLQLIVSFTTNDPDTGKPTNDRTNTGDSVGIFRTVQRILLDYLKSLSPQQHPDQIVFSAEASDPKRVKLYQAIANSNRIPGYQFDSQQTREATKVSPTMQIFVMGRTS